MQPPEHQEVITKNSKYHFREYRATKTHTSSIRTWNSLPAVQISVPTLEAFKVELDCVHV